MTNIPSDGILERMDKQRIRESDQLKTVLVLYDMEIYQKISKLDHQKLKTMVQRSIDQKLRLRNFDARRNFLFVESKRSVFERRPVQFPTRES